MLFEGARLITGDGAAPVENAAFIVEGNKFSRIGRKGELKAPDQAVRVDLTGKTVMPAIIDTHAHFGLTRGALLDELHRQAFYGVAVGTSLGKDFSGDLPFQVHQMIIPGAALSLIQFDA